MDIQLYSCSLLYWFDGCSQGSLHFFDHYLRIHMLSLLKVWSVNGRTCVDIQLYSCSLLYWFDGCSQGSLHFFDHNLRIHMLSLLKVWSINGRTSVDIRRVFWEIPVFDGKILVFDCFLDEPYGSLNCPLMKNVVFLMKMIGFWWKLLFYDDKY